METINKEQQLIEAAEKYYSSRELNNYKGTHTYQYAIDRWVDAAKSEASRVYHEQLKVTDLSELPYELTPIQIERIIMDNLKVYEDGNLSDIDIISNVFYKLLKEYRKKPIQKQCNWISVDSAPKDGTDILGYDPDTDTIYKCWWNSTMGDGCWNYDGHQYIPKVTLWQPLPKTPKDI